MGLWTWQIQSHENGLCMGPFSPWPQQQDHNLQNNFAAHLQQSNNAHHSCSLSLLLAYHITYKPVDYSVRLAIWNYLRKIDSIRSCDNVSCIICMMQESSDATYVLNQLCVCCCIIVLCIFYTCFCLKRNWFTDFTLSLLSIHYVTH